MKKILFYTLLIVLFVNCRKVEAKKDPIEGTWRFHEVFTENLSINPNINEDLSCANEYLRGAYNGRRIYMGFQKDGKGYFNARAKNVTYETRAEASWYKEDGGKYVLNIFLKQTTPAGGMTLNSAQHQNPNILFFRCYLKNNKEMECTDWVLIEQKDLFDCKGNPINNITPTQLQYRFKKD